MPNPVYPQITAVITPNWLQITAVITPNWLQSTAVITPTWFGNGYAAYAVVAAPRVADVQAAASVHGTSGTKTVPKVHQRAREALRGEPAFGADVLESPARHGDRPVRDTHREGRVQGTHRGGEDDPPALRTSASRRCIRTSRQRVTVRMPAKANPASPMRTVVVMDAVPPRLSSVRAASGGCRGRCLRGRPASRR